MDTNLLSRLMLTLLIGFSASVGVAGQEGKAETTTRPRVMGIPRTDRVSTTPAVPTTPALGLNWIKEFEPSSYEKKLLMVDAESEARFAKFLAQPDTGIIRLLPYESGRVVSAAEPEGYRRPGFAYFAATYSFSRRKHGYGLSGWHRAPFMGMAELKLTDDTLNTGFMEDSVGVMMRLGNVPLEFLTLQTEGVRQLAAMLPPADQATPMVLPESSRRGIDVNSFKFVSNLPATLNTTYALRSTLNRRADVLVCFRIVQRAPDGGITILWKKLKTYPKPSWQRKPHAFTRHD